MPITVEYGPAGLAGALAVGAGQAAGQARQHQYDLDSLQLTLQAQKQVDERVAREKAFELQSAVADKMLLAQTRTPAADHIKEAADLKRTERTAQQKVFKTQLDEMLVKGDIDPAAYRRGLLAVTTGNDTLLTDLLKPVKPTVEKPNISNTQEVEAIRSPFREKRRGLESELHKVVTTLADPFTAQIPDEAAALKKQKGDLQDRIDALYAEEAAALGQFRQQGRGMYAPEAPAPKPGSTSIKFTPTMSESENQIIRWAREAGMDLDPTTNPEVKIRAAGGTKSLGTPAQPQAFPDGFVIVNKQTGQRLVMRQGQWTPLQ